MAEDKILYRVEDNIAVITLNRPEQRNAQDLDFILQLDAAFSRAADDKHVTQMQGDLEYS